MPATFSAATCITYNPGPVPAEGPFEIYLNNDYDVPPFIPYLTLWDVTGAQCPYIIEVPTGTTVINFKDIVTNYCINIPVQDNDICTNCNLGLSDYSSTTSSVITAGYLTGSCTTYISDYKINWYGPDNTTTFSFSSGSGIYSSESTYPHPLTNNQSVPVIAGTYKPIIETVIINGITYSNTGDTGSIIADLTCLPTINVLPLTCDFKTNPSTEYPFSAYTHYLEFDAEATEVNPVTSTFKISADTKFLAWKFKAKELTDRLTISLSGSSYGTTIIGLEDIVVGSSGNINSFFPTTIPKSSTTINYFTKITTLTGLTINNNDNIIIKITPSTPGTKWYFYISCLDNFDCVNCLTNNSYPKIIGNTINSFTGACDHTIIRYNVSGCSNDEVINTDFYTYLDGETKTQYLVGNANISSDFYKSTITCQTAFCSYTTAPKCTGDTESTSYDKTFLPDGKGVFGFTGSSTFISTYYNGWVNTKSSCWSGATSPTELYYYRYISVVIPAQGAPINCISDSTTTKLIELYFHPTSTVLTGTTGSKYYMKITGNTMTNGLIINASCGNCNTTATNYVNSVNNTSTGTTTAYGTNRIFDTGIYYRNPVFAQIINQVLGNAYTAATYYGTWTTSTNMINTYPFSGTPSTIIPSLSGTVCDYNLTGSQATQNTGNQNNTHYKWYYKNFLTNPLDSRDYEIWAAPIINYTVDTNNLVLAYKSVAGNMTFSNPTYIS